VNKLNAPVNKYCIILQYFSDDFYIMPGINIDNNNVNPNQNPNQNQNQNSNQAPKSNEFVYGSSTNTVSISLVDALGRVYPLQSDLIPFNLANGVYQLRVGNVTSRVVIVD
jgi:hypothetical protein